MTANDISQLIGTLGFPIVCCVALFWQSNQQDKKHEAEMEKITEALNNNTIAITKLVERMEK